MELLQESHPAPHEVLERLRMLDVLVQDDEQLFLLDPIVRRAWSQRNNV
ncbi:hypothetical protein [Streptomyces sp. NBC_00005]